MKSPRPDQLGDETTWRLPPYSVEATFVTLSETVDWGLSNFGIPDQWRDTRGGGVRVAVIDTGIEASHPDLAGSIDDARDFSGSPFGSEDHVGHGTHVAGTIAARQNDQGVVGVARNAACWWRKYWGTTAAAAAAAWPTGSTGPARLAPDVLSMSLGSPVPDRAIRAAIQRAVAAGKFVVCAAGNEGRPDSVNFPARWPETLAIGAVDRHGRVARFSSRGEQVDVCALGRTCSRPTWTAATRNFPGTSMATPFVSGVVALLIAKHRQQGGGTPIATQQELVDHLRRTAIDAGPQGKDPNYGYGLIDPKSVLAIDAGDSDDEAPFEIGPVRVNGVEGVFVFMPR
ncbi:MAG: S8 family serine peptidase [Pirellulales bacterium]